MNTFEDQSWYVQKLTELHIEIQLGIKDIDDVLTDEIMQKFKEADKQEKQDVSSLPTMASEYK